METEWKPEDDYGILFPNVRQTVENIRNLGYSEQDGLNILSKHYGWSNDEQSLEYLRKVFNCEVDVDSDMLQLIYVMHGQFLHEVENT